MGNSPPTLFPEIRLFFILKKKKGRFKKKTLTGVRSVGGWWAKLGFKTLGCDATVRRNCRRSGPLRGGGCCHLVFLHPKVAV